MADDFTSDEDKYADESFENESDVEIPEISTSENESDLERDYKRKHEMYTSYTHMKNRNTFSKPYAHFESSSDDDNDVIISKTVAEINTEPMIMDDAQTARSQDNEYSAKTLRCSSATMREESIPEENELDAVYEAEGACEEESEAVATDEESVEEEEAEGEEQEEEEVLEQENRANEEYSNSQQQFESEIDAEEIPESARTLAGEDKISTSADHLESIAEVKKAEQEEPIEELTLGESPKDKPRIIRYRYIATNEERYEDNFDDNYFVHENSSDKVKLDNYRYANAEEVYSNAEAETEVEVDSNEPQFEFRISSQTPTSFNTNDYAFHMNFIRKSESNEKLRMRPVQRKSWSFTNERMREIERGNQILLKKILTQKPTITLNPQKSKSNCNLSAQSSCTRLSSAAINRKKQQKQIDIDNQILKRKLEAIALRRPVL